MRHTKIKISRDNIYFGCYFVLILISLIQYTNISDIFGSSFLSFTNRSLYIVFLCMSLILMTLKPYKGRELFLIVIIASSGLLSYYCSGSHTFLDISLLLCCAKSIDFDKFCKKTFIVQFTSVLSIVLLCSIGLISDSTRYHSANRIAGSSMGFNHPNTLALLVFQLIAFILIRKKDGRGIVKYLACIGAGLICYSVTDSNTGIIVSAILIIACMIYDFLNRGILTEKQIKRIVTFVSLIVVVVGIYIIVYYWKNPYQLQGLARTMRSRILMAQEFIDSYGIHLFGNSITIEEGAWLDNAQVRLLVQYGIIPFFIYYWVMIKMMVGLLREGDIVVFIVAMAYIVYSLSEFKSIRPEYNFMWIYAGIQFFGSTVKHGDF